MVEDCRRWSTLRNFTHFLVKFTKSNIVILDVKYSQQFNQNIICALLRKHKNELMRFKNDCGESIGKSIYQEKLNEASSAELIKKLKDVKIPNGFRTSQDHNQGQMDINRKREIR